MKKIVTRLVLLIILLGLGHYFFDFAQLKMETSNKIA